MNNSSSLLLIFLFYYMFYMFSLSSLLFFFYFLIRSLRFLIRKSTFKKKKHRRIENNSYSQFLFTWRSFMKKSFHEASCLSLVFFFLRFFSLFFPFFFLFPYSFASLPHKEIKFLWVVLEEKKSFAPMGLTSRQTRKNFGLAFFRLCELVKILWCEKNWF